VTSLPSLVIAGCLRNEYKFSRLIFRIKSTNALKDQTKIKGVSQRGYSPSGKGHNLNGRPKIKPTKELYFSGPGSSHLRRKRYSSHIAPPPDLEPLSSISPHYQTLPLVLGKIMLK